MSTATVVDTASPCPLDNPAYISGPFGYLVRLDQPTLHGLSRHGVRTQLYTSRGTGFWGPPFRIFAPPEIAVLTLRPAPGPTGS